MEKKVIKEVKIGETTYKLAELGFLDLFDLADIKSKREQVSKLICLSIVEPKMNSEDLNLSVADGLELLKAVTEINNLDKIKSNLPEGVSFPN